MARSELYKLVDAAQDTKKQQVTLIAKGRTTAALIPLGRLDAAALARLGAWPSWARTKARPKLGDLVRDAVGTPAAPGVPQVLMDRTTPVAVLIDATLLPADGGPVTVPGDPADGAAPTPAGAGGAVPADGAPGAPSGAPVASADRGATDSASAAPTAPAVPSPDGPHASTDTDAPAAPGPAPAPAPAAQPVTGGGAVAGTPAAAATAGPPTSAVATTFSASPAPAHAAADNTPAAPGAEAAAPTSTAPAATARAHGAPVGAESDVPGPGAVPASDAMPSPVGPAAPATIAPAGHAAVSSGPAGPGEAPAAPGNAPAVPGPDSVLAHVAAAPGTQACPAALGTPEGPDPAHGDVVGGPAPAGGGAVVEPAGPGADNRAAGSVPDAAAAVPRGLVAGGRENTGPHPAEDVPAQDAAAEDVTVQDDAAEGVAAGDASVRDAAAPAAAAPVSGPRRLRGLDEAVLDELLAPTDQADAAPRAGGPVTFGLPALDRALATLTPGRLTLIAAAPGAGGSLLAAAAARHTALTHHHPVLYAASGLTRNDIAARIVAAHTPVDYRRLRTGALTAAELEAAAGVRAQLAAAPLLIDDGTGLTAAAIAQTVPDVEELALVVVDRLQHAHDPAMPLSGPALPAAARTLAHLARTHQVPVLAVLDTDDPHAVAALAPGLTLTLTRADEHAELAVVEPDFGCLAVFPLAVDLACARFTEVPCLFDAGDILTAPGGRAALATVMEAAVPFLAGTPGPDQDGPDGDDSALPPASLVLLLRYLRSSLSPRYEAYARRFVTELLNHAAHHPRLPETAEGRRLAAALGALVEHAVAHGYRPDDAGPPDSTPPPGIPAAPAVPAAPGSASLPPALTGPYTPVGPLAGPSRPPVTGQAVTGPHSPATSTAAHPAQPAAANVPAAATPQALAGPGTDPGEPAAPAVPAAAVPGPSTPAPAGAPASAPAPGAAAPVLGAGEDLATAEAELLEAALPFLAGAQGGLSARLTGTMAALRDARTNNAAAERGETSGAAGTRPEAAGETVLVGLRRTMAELAARAPRMPETPEGARLHAAVAAYATAHSGPAAPALTASTPAPTTAQDSAPPAVLSVAEPAPAPAGHQPAAAAPDATPVPAAAAPGGHPAQAGRSDRPVEAPEAPEEEASEVFQDTTAPPEADVPASRTSARVYTFFLNKITAAVDQALEEAGGDMEAATKALIRKAVPDSMALFKLTRVGANYVHTVYPRLEEFLTKPAQGSPDQVWEGRHKWRNQPLADAVRKGTREPLDVTALDTNAAYLSAFKTHLPIGALQHDPTGTFDRRRAGIHRVDHFEWPHTHLPNPLGNRVEPGPYYLDDATLRLLIRCHEKFGLCEAPRILESWTSGASEALLEKFRRVLQQARTTAIENNDTVTLEYVKAMYSRFTSTIGESGKNTELRRPEWVHTIRSQAFASLWLKAWKAHENGLILVQVSGVDELHVAGGDWRQVFEEGRQPTEMKEKRLYTLGGK
ncbi:DnaB-like helicase C-terminal domain-containing protein [Streptomyces syringium]|uniref:DnaB-like helicase C-terminal domain-containing protein n=1 Tax=Streptomyces syringium TaxID=76729 RepID=UPI0033F967C7